MSLGHWFSFLCVALLVSFTPGPAVLLAVSNTLAHGPARAMVGSLGNALGLLIVSAATTAGLGLLLRTSATAFLVLKTLGAAYLIYLGVRQWRSQGDWLPDHSDAAVPPVSAGRLWLRGLWVALTNPKTILFFSALFPQFLRDSGQASGQLVLLTLTFVGAALVAHACYVLLARILVRHLRSPVFGRVAQRVFGGTFMLLGAGLLGLRHKAA